MLAHFHPLVDQWFREQLGTPTEPQSLGWPHIAQGRHTLIAAPTGSGKTLAAFLCSIDTLLRDWLDGRLEDHVRVVYVSPLKALSNDIHRNLEVPLAQISERCVDSGQLAPPIRTAVRTGDTPAADRQKMLRRPPHILVTTPESLYLLLTSEKGRENLRRVKTVIVDEIHALARDKRGSHFALSLQRLERLCDQSPQRIGLSATQRPIEQIAQFLVGTNRIDAAGRTDCAIVDAGHVRQLDLALEVPPSELSAVCSHEQWAESYSQLVRLINEHRSTLIFVNTRRLAERISHHLGEILGEDAVASHHGSLARQIRLSAEERLKSGQLKAIVATASLEMGIDIGFVDLVCQIGSPRSIATFLQRVGRSGHTLGKVPKGRLFPLTRDELIECLALVRAVREQRLDAIEPPVAPLDILAQQIVATVAAEEISEDELYDLCVSAWPYQDLSRDQFDRIVQMVSEGVAPTSRRGAYLHRDAIAGHLRARRGARIAALTSGGAIPETAEYRVVTDPEGTLVGKVDEDFAIESHAGDIFLLGNTSWRVLYVREGKVVVQDAQGAPPSIPFWFGEAPGRTIELSTEISRLRMEIGERLGDAAPATCAAVAQWLIEACGATQWAATQAVRYVEVQRAALGLVPTNDEIVFERFFDESGGTQLVIHGALGARINRAWGLALRKRFCRSFDFELQAAATDNGVLLSTGPQHSFPIENLFKMIGPHNARYLLEQALLASPIFQTRWRWNVTRALAVLRTQFGKKVPPHLQRFRSDDLLSAVFPQSTGCLENHHGDVEIPDHPLVKQTVHDALTEAMDLDRWVDLLRRVESGEVTLIARDTREPSPFAHELLNANPYAFLDDAPLEERRTRAVSTRRGLAVDEFSDLARLDDAVIRQVALEAWPLVRDVDELHDALLSLVAVDEDEMGEWSHWRQTLVDVGRVSRVVRDGAAPLWVAAENWPLVAAIFPEAKAEPPVKLPARLARQWERTEAMIELFRGRLQHCGPVVAIDLAQRFGLEPALVEASLEALEGQGVVMRGHFNVTGQSGDVGTTTQWCDRRLLARIHRQTLVGLRRQIKPVEPVDFIRFLIRHHHLEQDDRWGGPVGVREVLSQLQGFEAPAAVWESQLIGTRVRDCDPQWLDHLFLTGEAVWGRLKPPRRDAEDGPSMAMLTRTVPITLALRDDLPWLLPDDRADGADVLRSNADAVYQSLKQRGALFFAQLQSITGLLPAHLEEALRELATLGLVTSDNYAAVRAIVGGRRGRRRSGRRPKTAAAPAGRWSLFPGYLDDVDEATVLQNWCRQLLQRYGVVFRELLTRETAAPPWYRLVSVFRRLELQGQIRGGRFVSGVGGEQYAREETITALRAVRDQPADGKWVVLSAADPLNLVGIVTPGNRIASSHKTAVALLDGHCVAVKQAGQVRFETEVSPAQQSEMTYALTRCG